VRDLVIQSENDDPAGEITYDLVIGFGPGRPGGTIAQFGQRDYRNGNCFGVEVIKPLTH
jgi:hypothetical protein